MDSSPSIDAQRSFWNGWNRQRPLNDFTQRQLQVASDVARRVRPQRILDVGCGTGWLGASLQSFGRVTGIDLSDEAIARGRDEHPQVDLIAGDFETTELPPNSYDLVVSADALAHVADQPRFIRNVARVLAPGGTFLLMSQNPFVWRRCSYLAPQGAGQIRNWPPTRRIRELLAPSFDLRSCTTIFPGGNRGLLIWVDNRVSRALWKSVRPWRAILEGVRLGRELVIEAVKRRHARGADAAA